ncbi:hypothetical protein GCM10022420_035950 [Streptomyces iranensis]
MKPLLMAFRSAVPARCPDRARSLDRRDPFRARVPGRRPITPATPAVAGTRAATAYDDTGTRSVIAGKHTVTRVLAVRRPPSCESLEPGSVPGSRAAHPG